MKKTKDTTLWLISLLIAWLIGLLILLLLWTGWLDTPVSAWLGITVIVSVGVVLAGAVYLAPIIDKKLFGTKQRDTK